MLSLLADRCDFRYVVFQDNGYELGVVSGIGHHMYLYLAWREGNKVKWAEGDWDHNSTDELLMELVAVNPTAAGWLLNKRLLLKHPKETIIAMVKAKIIYGTVEETSNGQGIKIYKSNTETINLLKHYGWNCVTDVSTDYYHCDFPNS